MSKYPDSIRYTSEKGWVVPPPAVEAKLTKKQRRKKKFVQE